MRRLTLDEWEKHYVSGQIDKFDQKHTMFRRVTWDEDIKSKLKNWSFQGAVESKPYSSRTSQARCLPKHFRREAIQGIASAAGGHGT